MPRLLRLYLLGGLALLLAGLAAAWAVPLPARLRLPGSRSLLWRDGRTAHVLLAPDDRWRVPVQPEEVDPDYLRALLYMEDRRFWRHPGVDPFAVLRAALQDLAAGRVVSGGSTLSLQLVRVLEPRPRTLGSKLLEALRALQLEVRLSKREILAAYLSFAPYGRNVEGVQAASLAYFGHGARDLSPEEIATLLAVPQDPSGRYPSPGHRGRLRAARDRILARLQAAGLLPPVEEPAEVPGELRPFPRALPWLARELFAERPGALRLRTSLDRGVQGVVERVAERARRQLPRLGIRNAAVVVVEHRTGKVRALLGNLDFWGEDGQLAAYLAPRSPGSALKPFLYLLAVDRGIALPAFRIPDVPVDYGGYRPGNYDGTYSGLVTLDEALSRSLNVPFVELLERIGVQDFLATLRSLGVRSLRDPSTYGLSAAVGGLELTPLEMAGAYAALAEGGVPRDLTFLEDEEPPPGPRVFSEGACWLARRALSRRDRPDFPGRREVAALASDRRGIHWKTGTSQAHRDAWAVGSGPRYTVAVWCGNLDYRPSAALVGAEVAGPILFDVLEGIESPRPAPPDPPPPELVRVEVCAFSGRPPSAACPERRLAWALRDHVPTETCPYHVRRAVDLETGLALSPRCLAGHRWEERSFLQLPGAVRRLLGGGAPGPPAWAPGCAPLQDRRLAILSPPAGQDILLIPGLPAEEQEVPLVAESSEGGELQWFADGRWLGSAPVEERLWWTPSPGRHVLAVQDATGKVVSRKVDVRFFAGQHVGEPGEGS